MKNILFILISVFTINELTFGQEVLFPSNFGSNKKQSVFFNTLTDNLEQNDLGHWVGIRFGGQIKPKNSKVDNWYFFEQWTLFTSYEYRFDRKFSLIAEYHLFKDRDVNYKRTLSAIEIGLKFRFQVIIDLMLAPEAGLVIMRSPAIPFYYGLSMELKMNENTSLCINAKTNNIPDYGYWLSTGINYKIFEY